MDLITFGFMDPARGYTQNANLFIRLRSQAIKSFKDESVCDLSSFASDSIEDCHKILSADDGKNAGMLRDRFYESLSARKTNIKLPDVQSFFLYSFTLGINQFAIGLRRPGDVYDPKPFSAEDVLSRRFPIRGPEWVCNTANMEMYSVENAFCDLQNEILVPTAKGSPSDYALLSDIIAGSFLWSFFAGIYWLNEAVEEIRGCLSLTGGITDGSGVAMYQVKKSMQLIGDEDIERVMEAVILRET